LPANSRLGLASFGRVGDLCRALCGLSVGKRFGPVAMLRMEMAIGLGPLAVLSCAAAGSGVPLWEGVSGILVKWKQLVGGHPDQVALVLWALVIVV